MCVKKSDYCHEDLRENAIDAIKVWLSANSGAPFDDALDEVPYIANGFTPGDNQRALLYCAFNLAEIGSWDVDGDLIPDGDTSPSDVARIAVNEYLREEMTVYLRGHFDRE